MNNQLREALDTIMDIQDAQGTNRKKQLLEYHSNNDTLKDILHFVFNPYIRTGIGKTKLHNMPLGIDIPEDIENYTIQGTMTYLLHNNTGRDVDVLRVMQFVEGQTFGVNPRFSEILYDVFTKDLKMGISTTTINKVFPNLIPGFGLQLACKWQDNISILQNQEIFVTEKLDGNRCFAQVKDHKATLFSRSGRIIEGLTDVEQELSAFIDGWYDGELLARTFNETQSTIRKKGTKKDVVFNIFDYLTLEEVEKQTGTEDYMDRRGMLDGIFVYCNATKYTKPVPLIYKGKFDEDTVLSLLQQYTSNGSEGLMINLNSPYQFDRTNQLLKVKNMGTIDLKIIGLQEGRGEFANTCGALTVEYKGYPVGVGSGLSKFDREYFWNNKEDIIGRVAEIQYFEETRDQNGNLSLRFPVFKGLREEGKEVSYE